MGHIPPAFEEPEILQFLSQFGKVTNVKLSRSKRTGNPRGYAFVEFADMEVAAIVAETMSGYFLLGERRLVCHVVPQDKIHPELFHGAKGNLAQAQAGRTSSDRLKILHQKQMQKVNATKSVTQLNKITKRLLSREKNKREQLKTMGIDYDFPGYTATATIKDVVQESGKKRKISIDENEEKESTIVVKTTKAKKGKTPTKKSASKRKASEVAEAEPIKAQDEETVDVPVKTPQAKKSKTPTKKSASKKVVEAEPPVKAKDEETVDAPVKTPKAKKGKTPTKKSVSKKDNSAVVEAEPVKAQDEEMEDAPVKTPKAKKGKTPTKKSVSKKVVEAEPVKAQDEEMEDAPVKTPKAKTRASVRAETEAKKSKGKPKTRRSVS
jgi:nucleolar protein 15